MSLERQVNYSIKTTFFRSKHKSLRDIRLNENILSVRQRLDFGSVSYFYDYITCNKETFSKDSKLPSANFFIKEIINKIIFQDHRTTSYLNKSFHTTAIKWNHLPQLIRLINKSSSVKRHLKNYYLESSRLNPPSYVNCTWKNIL